MIKYEHEKHVIGTSEAFTFDTSINTNLKRNRKVQAFVS